MGNCNPADAESRKWDKELTNDKMKASQVFKLLLLGTGNSGKSTFFKQLTQIHGGGFQDSEFRDAAKQIQDSVVGQMKNLLNTFRHPEADEFKVDLPSELQQAAKTVYKSSLETPLSTIANEIYSLWNNDLIRDAYTNRTNEGIADSAPHFLDNLDRISASDYRPTPEDILFARIPTSGMRDKKFTIKDTVFNIFDVGGQRSERNKWIHCFDTVHGIIFVASLSCYDQNLYEENDLNAMDETLELFSIVVNSRYFSRASMILFLNKNDLFIEKIKSKPLTICFPEYDGSNEYAETIDYITMKFKQRITAKHATKSIYVHVTCATDRDNVKRVFDDVQHAIVTSALRHNGLI